MAQVFATYRVQTLHRPCVLSYGVAAGALVPAHRAAGTDLPGSVPRLMHRGSGTLVYEDRAAYSDLCVAQDLSICCCPTAAQHPDTTASRRRASILAWLIDGADVLA